jgi:uncharacterized protein YdbL (DUF1318 family)
MNRRHLLTLVLISAMSLLVVSPSPALAQDSVESVTASMKARYREVYKAKLQGLIGETHDGMVAAVKAGAPDALISAENADRTKLYALLAAREGTTPQQVALVNGTRNFRNASPEEWLRPADGNWVQKKNMR